MTKHQWKDRVASLGCILCRKFDMAQEGRTLLHHARKGQGMSQRGSDWLVIPLCREHHVGKTGVHGDRFYTTWKLDEMDLLAFTIEAAS